MKRLDDALRDAAGNEMESNDTFDPSLYDLVTDSFRGRLRWLTVMTWFGTLICFTASIVFAILFFDQDDVRGQIMFATLFLWSVIAVGMLKTLSFIWMIRNSTAREIKRLELQIAQLTALLQSEGK